MLKINTSEWKTTSGKMFLGKLIIELIGGYFSLNFCHLRLLVVKFNLNPIGANNTIGTSLPNNSVILSNQISLPSLLPYPLKGGLQRIRAGLNFSFISDFSVNRKSISPRRGRSESLNQKTPGLISLPTVEKSEHFQGDSKFPFPQHGSKMGFSLFLFTLSLNNSKIN
jgi:hypothetical protein